MLLYFMPNEKKQDAFSDKPISTNKAILVKILVLFHLSIQVLTVGTHFR